MNERDSAVVGIRGNVYNWLSYGVVGNSVCRTWESCTLAFPCAVNRVIHDSIACYAHFHNACLLVFVSLIWNSVVLAVYHLFLVSASLSYMSICARIVIPVSLKQIDDAPYAYACPDCCNYCL